MLARREGSLVGSFRAGCNGALPESLVGPHPAEAGYEEDPAKLQAPHTVHGQQAAILVAYHGHCLHKLASVHLNEVVLSRAPSLLWAALLTIVAGACFSGGRSSHALCLGKKSESMVTMQASLNSGMRLYGHQKPCMPSTLVQNSRGNRAKLTEYPYKTRMLEEEEGRQQEQKETKGSARAATAQVRRSPQLGPASCCRHC